MNLTRKKVLLVAASTLSLTIIATTLYHFSLPPFKKKGAIRAEEVCDSLGGKTDAVSTLKAILPDKASYSFNDSTTDPRIGERDDSYASSCFVSGDGEQLLSARTEMLEYRETDSWVREAVEQFAPRASLESFPAGDKAVASSKVSAIYVPCTSHGVNRHLSVIVRLKQHGEADPSELRQHLIVLTKEAASRSHEAAHCDVPSRVSS
ncbi:hypothetical protein ACF1AE_05235 [Streptomyces sp. NPDC014986]|uniref:hypothetical protein n=1 Tax=Streptomyces sp. NPDC014986 TaxID=3364934 RepID=UPI0036F5FA48